MSEAASNALGSANLCLGNSGLAAGTTTTLTTLAVAVSIRGVVTAIGAATNGATPTTDFVTGAAFRPVTPNMASVFVVGYDAGGTRRAIQGSMVSNSAYIAGDAALDFPDVPRTVAPVGYVVIQGGPTLSGSWIFGTHNVAGVTGVTYSFVSVSHLPASPLAL